MIVSGPIDTLACDGPGVMLMAQDDQNVKYEVMLCAAEVQRLLCQKNSSVNVYIPLSSIL